MSLPHALSPFPVDALLEAVCFVDGKNRQLVQLNAAACALLGTTPGEALGQRITEWLPAPEDAFYWEDAGNGARYILESETTLKTGQDEWRQVHRRITPFTAAEGQPGFLVVLQDCSEKRKVENELEHLIGELRATLESTADAILVTDHEGAIRGCNGKFAQLFRIPQSLLTRRNDEAVIQWLHQCCEDPRQHQQRWNEIQVEAPAETNERVPLNDGRILEQLSLPQFARGEPIGRVFSFRDITERLRYENSLKLSALVFEHSPEGIFIADRNFVVRDCNPAFRRLCEIDSAQGLLLDDIFTFKEARDTLMDWRQREDGGTARHDEPWHGELWIRRMKSGSALPCHVSLVRLHEQGNAQTLGLIQDMSESLAAKARIEELAYRDALTGLANRHTLQERFQYLIQQCTRNNSHFAVLFLDLDRFKNINDSLGHAFGDQLLKEVANRLQTCVRQIDMVARLGGDEFMLLLCDAHQRGAELTARRILNELSSAVQLGELDVNVSTSIGIALFPDDGEDMESLIKNADSAMYSVKERGRDDFRFYQKAMNVGLLSRVKMDTAIRNALEREHFELHYQPLVCLASGRILGAEALMRWQHPQMGAVPPAQFIPIAEESGAIVALGKWALLRACQQMMQWRSQGHELTVAVNVSGLQFAQSSFVETVASVLESTGLPAHLLELELTESVLIHEADEALAKLSVLNAMGVSVAIDDFGTGYSSFSYLRRYPVDKLKIDRSFINRLPHNGSDAAIVSAILSMAQALDMKVVAEGVETAEQVAFLRSLKCEMLQGYWFSPALGVDAFLKLLDGKSVVVLPG